MPKAKDISHLPLEEQQKILDKRAYVAAAVRKNYDKVRTATRPKRNYQSLTDLTIEERNARKNEQTAESKRRARQDADRWSDVKSKTMAWRRDNKDSVRLSRKVDAANNGERKKSSDKAYREKPEIKARRNERVRGRRSTDPAFRLARVLRSRLFAALRGELKADTTMNLVGCSLEALIDHLERQFSEGMTWTNAGTWHVDHITPVAAFNMSEPEEQKKCFHWTNLQPLWGEDNMKKGWKL